MTKNFWGCKCRIKTFVLLLLVLYFLRGLLRGTVTEWRPAMRMLYGRHRLHLFKLFPKTLLLPCPRSTWL